MATSDLLKRLSELSPKRLVLLAAELQSKLDAAEQQKSSPIAVVGMSCRFPGGANDPNAYWELLRSGVDAVQEVPASRWDIDAFYDPDPEAPGKMSTRWGGFLDQVDQFDPQFFGISPREALSMDPQQRLLLEVSWEALENAGYAPNKLMNTQTGVFVGLCNADYGTMMLGGQTDQIDLYLATGGASSIASGRLSYILGLQGPSISVDTACSSSLVSVHLAVQALRTGDCRMALAGGVNLILMPETTITLSKANMMSPDGRCKAFDIRADGFVRGEGCGIIVLKKLTDALADGDRVLAVIRGSAINQDGRSNGLTAPNGPSQVSVVRAALADARVEPKDVSYIETHGTGTSLGDPIEVQALGASVGSGHSTESPLVIGSVKTNLGHLESAAGIAGLIKLILMVQKGEIPPHLHLTEPNPYIPWNELPIAIPQERMPWQPASGRRIGGVSSFGFSGTNAHIIVEQPPVTVRPAPENERPLHIFTLSAKDESVLLALADKLEQHLDQNPESAGDLAYTLNSGRAHFHHRLALVAKDMGGVLDALAAYRMGERRDHVFTGEENRDKRIAFLFSGQGSQHAGMGQELYQTQPVFRDAINRCDEILKPILDRSLLSILFPTDGEESPIHEIAYAQPAQFAVEYALAELWSSWGIKPSVVVGHSVGEYVAACVAGVFSLEDGLKLVAARGRLMSQTATGEMASVFTSADHVARVIAPYQGRVSIAAVNGPETVVISGEHEAVQSAIDDLKAEKIRARRLDVSIAAHSPLMEPILDAFARAAADVTYRTPQIELISCVTGKFVQGSEIASMSYWQRHMRAPVQFNAAMQTLHESGYDVFMEIGPAPALVSLGQRILPEDTGIWLPSLRPGHGDWETMLKSLAALYTYGIDVNWAGFDHAYARNRLALPTYPFRRERYWLQQPAKKQAVLRVADGAHPLLGRRLKSPAIRDVVFETQLSANWPTFLDHHRIFGVVIMPSPAYLEMALQAAAAAFGPGTYRIEDFTIYSALVLPEDDVQDVQFVLSPGENGSGAFEVVSPDRDDWKRHVSGKIRPGVAANSYRFDAARVQARCTEIIDGNAYYDRMRELGLEFGSNFRGLKEIWRSDGEALGRVELPEELIAQAGQYTIHPAFLDACFHLLGAPFSAEELDAAYLLIGIDSFELYQSPRKALWNHTVISEAINHETFAGDIQLYDDDGLLVAEVRGLRLKRAGRDALLQATGQRPDDLFYQVEWVKKPARQLNLIAAAQIAAMVAPTAAAQVEDFPALIYADLSAALHHLSIGYIVRALTDLGWQMRPDHPISFGSLVSDMGITDRHRSLLRRLLDTLVQEGILRRSGDEYTVVQRPGVNGFSSEADLVADFPDYAPIVQIFSRCAPALASVLRGETDPLHLLFPGGSFAEAEALYREVPTALLYNGLVREIVQSAIDTGGRVRILEIGAGTGGTTAHLLPMLPADRTEYVFTDLSPLFLEQAQAAFSAYSFVRYELLNIEDDPAAQGFEGQTFDLIVAANALHATADLAQTMAHVRQMLSPGGLLVLLEGTRPETWVDLTFGLTEGWWRFNDYDLRPAYPLLDRAGWHNLLDDAGFQDITVLPQIADDSILNAQSVIFASGPASGEFALASGRWLIFADQNGLGDALADALASGGAAPVLVTPGDQAASLDDTHWQIAPDQPNHYRQLLAGESWAGVVHLWSLNHGSGDSLSPEAMEAAVMSASGSVLLLAQALIEQRLPARLWLVTENVQPMAEPVVVSGSPLWGFGRVMALEHPEYWGGLIDVAGRDALPERARMIASEITMPDGEDQIAIRHGERYAARLARIPAFPSATPQFRRDGSYLVTGGLGGLGLNVAQWMAENGAGHLILTSRRGLPERSRWAEFRDDARIGSQIAAVEGMEVAGATVTIAAVDVSDSDAMTALVHQYQSSLRGVFHLAAALEFWPVAEMPLDGLAAMLRSKITGAWLLHRLTEGLDLDHFVLFSSTTALWGVTQMAHYAAANTFLDTLAHYRQSLSLPALSINWGTWEEMRIATAEQQESVAQFGLSQIPTQQALDILGDLLDSPNATQVAVAAVNWEILKPAYEVRRERPFLADVAAPVRPVAREANRLEDHEAAALREQLSGLSVEERQDLLIEYVRETAAQILGMNPENTDIHRGLFEMGMDSLMSVGLKTRLETAVGKGLPSTLTFNYPTVAELADYLNRLLAPDQPTAVIPQETEPSAAPGDIDNLSEDELEDLLLKKLRGL